MPEETVRPAFTGRERPLLSYGIAFPAAAARNVTETFSASRMYVLCSGSLARNTDALDRLTAALGAEKVVGRQIGMQSHTLWSEVLEIVEDARNAQADLLLTLGAGSLTDGAKIIALVRSQRSIYTLYLLSRAKSNTLQALANQVRTAEDLETLAQGPKKRIDIKAPTIPIISVPTSLSAGEYSNFAGGTEDRSRRKYSFQAPLRGPALVILDPELAESTPDSIWLSTGVRAVDHCVETLCAIVGTTPESDKLAEHALGLLVPGLLRCKKNRADRDAHLQCQLGSVDAMAACTSGSVELGASHGIGHQVRCGSYLPRGCENPQLLYTSLTWLIQARPVGRRPRRNKLHPAPGRVQVQRNARCEPRAPSSRTRIPDPRSCCLGGSPIAQGRS